MAGESQRPEDSAWQINSLTASLFYHLHCGKPLRFAFPQFFINHFFNIGKPFIDMLNISPTPEHEKIGFHVFPNNHAKKDGHTQNDYYFHYFLLECCSVSACTV
jgi:hypothetical protein